jgi:phosphopantetheinyl transferase
MSQAEGVAVLVGSPHPIGIDIVCSDITEMLPPPSQSLVFSAREMEALRNCPSDTASRELASVLWAFKEAYMKYGGAPDWEHITSVEFLDIQIPTNGTCLTNAAGQILINNVHQNVYTECHNLDGSHFVVIYSAATDDAGAKFQEISLADIHPKI